MKSRKISEVLVKLSSLSWGQLDGAIDVVVKSTVRNLWSIRRQPCECLEVIVPRQSVRVSGVVRDGPDRNSAIEP